MRNILLFVLLILPELTFGQNLTLMTYNIRLDVSVDKENAWPNRKDFFVSQIRFYEPDIFGVQEARPNQVKDIDTGLKNYDYVGVGRDGKNKGEGSNVFYKKNKFEIIKSNTFWLSNTPYEVSKGWDAAYRTICTYALFKDLDNNKLFWVFNTHLDNKGEESRIEGVKLILSKIKELNSNNYPVFLLGDLNSIDTDNTISIIKKEMSDSMEKSIEKPYGPSGTFNNFEFNKPVTLKIDYIFISNNNKVTVNKYGVLSDSKNLRYPSDHLPIFIDVTIR